MRLIDADELRKKAQWMEMPDRQGINFDVRAVSVSSIDLSPIIDAVHVVRCGQCKHWKTADDYCTHPAGLCATGKKARNNYCSLGERKGGEGG